MNKIIYKHNVLSHSVFEQVKKECTTLNPFLKPDKSAAKNRTHVIVTDPNNILVQTFYGPAFVKRISNIVGVNIEPSPILPIEYRYYGKGSSMPWHRDQVITQEKNPQIEVVFTVHNHADSQTEWIDDATHKKHIVKSKPNTIMVTQGNSVFHRVTPITKGDRSIIKVAYDIISPP